MSRSEYALGAIGRRTSRSSGPLARMRSPRPLSAGVRRRVLSTASVKLVREQHKGAFSHLAERPRGWPLATLSGHSGVDFLAGS